MSCVGAISVEEINATSGAIVHASLRVHRELGPGLLESVYQRCLEYELTEAGLWVQSHVPCPITYGPLELATGFTLDMLVNDAVIVELKAVEHVHPIHQAQLMTYLRLRKRKLGLLINFNVVRIKDGITRIVNGL
ncbi:MAG TPA: GxxExxY protein [Gemmatimonadaceae bacterium]|nr:GxxExxY protein [Gemmatimonadaceae bacterium]